MFTVYQEALTPGKEIHIKLGFCSQIKTVEKKTGRSCPAPVLKVDESGSSYD